MMPAGITGDGEPLTLRLRRYAPIGIPPARAELVILEDGRGTRTSHGW